LATLNYIVPSVSFPNNDLYLFVSLIFGIIWTAFVTSSFVFAYVKYSDIKPVDGKIRAPRKSSGAGGRESQGF
jgi:hypothetical protein